MKKFLFIILLTSLLINANSQDQRLSFRFDSIMFNNLVDTLEKSIPVRIYYSNEWVDTLVMSVGNETNSLDDLLTGQFRRDGFSFFISDNGRIILSKGYSIKSNFATEYLAHLNKLTPQADTVEYTRPVFDVDDNALNDEFKLFKVGNASAPEGNYYLTGVVRSVSGNEPLPGVVVYIEKLKTGAMTNSSGYYSMQIPTGQYQLEYRMVGMRAANRNIQIYSDGSLDVSLFESSNILDEVTVSADRENNIRSVRSGIERINSKILKQIPLGLGEADVIKSTLLLPGVQTVGEASSGYNVRGGSGDQNLILLNNAPILNSSHFFGFFSAFNSDLIKDVTLYKNSMPAKYGGRLSSVMEISTLEGNREEVRVSGGISPVTGRILVEGPMRKNRSSFIIGGRATYSDWLLGVIEDDKLNNSSASFYDLQAMVSGDINNKNSYTVSGYYSDDKFNYYMEDSFSYGNMAATLKWKHTFSSVLSAQFYAVMSDYRYQLSSDQDSVLLSSISYRLSQNIARADFTYYPFSGHKVEFGADGTFYNLWPGERIPNGYLSEVTQKTLEQERALEPSVYISDEYTISNDLSVSAGIRTTLFTSFGPNTVYTYASGLPKSTVTITDTIQYSAGSIVKMYPAVDFRLSSRYALSSSLSIKAGYQRANQFIHMVSNNTSMSPTDVWKLSNSYIKPQQSDQISLGLVHLYIKRNIESSVELYYKRLENLLDYKSGAELLMNEHLETDIIQGNGKAYGAEFMIKKQSGSLTGWISYTYSRVLLKTDSEFEEEKINNGEYFPASYDKPHDLKVVANAKLSRRFNMTANFAYNTGRPITYPVAFFTFNNTSHVYYSNRNEFRIPDYMRLDLSATVNGNLKAQKLNHSSFTATVYNILGRKNPYSIFFKTENGKVQGYQMSIFARPIFMITYNFRIMGNATGDF